MLKIHQTLVLVLSLSLLTLAIASEGLTAQRIYASETRWVADVTLYSADDLKSVLHEISDYTENRPDSVGEYPPIVVLLHGPEVRQLDKKLYSQNKGMIDTAAKLDALEVIDLRVCETASHYHGVDTNNYPNFVSLVPSASKEIKKLTSQGYSHF